MEGLQPVHLAGIKSTRRLLSEQGFLSGPVQDFPAAKPHPIFGHRLIESYEPVGGRQLMEQDTGNRVQKMVDRVPTRLSRRGFELHVHLQT